MEIKKYPKGTNVELTLEIGHYTDPEKTAWVPEDLTDRKYYCWVYDRFKNIIAKFSKGDLSGRGFDLTKTINEVIGKFKVEISYTVTGASSTKAGEYYASVQIQDTDDDDNPYFTGSIGEPCFELVESVGNVFTSDPPNS
jgi:hypothetical protein